MRTTKIRTMQKDDDQIVLQGFDIDMGWTLAINRVTGNMRITFAGGNCVVHYLRSLYILSIEQLSGRKNCRKRMKCGFM